MIRDLWPNTRRERAVVALVVLTFCALDALVLMGSELALDLLVCLAGVLGGSALAYVGTYPFRARLRGSGLWRTAGVFLDLALVFAIIFGGSTLAGVSSFPTAESGNVGTLIYGFAFGFGIYVPRGLGLSNAPQASPRSRGTDLRVVTVTLGAVAGLFALFFALHVLVEYVAAPLIRHFAA